MYWSNISAAANAAAAYQTGQTAGYAVNHTTPAAAAAASYTTQRAATGSTYDTSYQTPAATHTSATATFPSAVASTTYEYGYGRSSQAPTAATVVAYDSTKAYYAQQSSTAYTTPDTHYQANKAGYSTATAYPTASRQATGVGASKPSYGATYTGATTGVVGGTATNASLGASINTNFHSSSFPRQSANANNKGSNKSGAGPWSFKKSLAAQTRNSRPKAQPKPQQLHYCDVCKISCAGPQTYREHLDGQKHKKKEASMKAGPTPCRHGTSLRCELCDVTCTGNDAYAAHIRGAKHQKVVKLHQKLGKPIPSTDPVVVSVAGKTTSSKSGASQSTSGAEVNKNNEPKEDVLEHKEKEIEPVGLEYIEEMKNAEVVSFNCKLCECRFNDPNAKEMHMKGRRHRLQYKKKVNPELVVEVKPSLRQRKMQDEKLRRQQLREEMWRRREEERLLEDEERWYWQEQRRMAEECEYFNWGRYPRGYPGNMPPPIMTPGGPHMSFMHQMMPIRRPDSSDDRHVLAKHAEIYPKEEELMAVQRIVSNTEKALKMTSDYLADLDEPKSKDKDEKKSPSTPTTDETSETTPEKKDSPPRMLKGVMRVGILAKGLLLKGNHNVELVVLCGEKPTRALLDRVADDLPKRLETVSTADKYEIQRVVEDAAIVVREVGASEPVSVTITLTSPMMRDHMPEHDGDSQVAAVKDAPDVLDKSKCLEALASLRHAKWFQARANGLQSCVVIIRILKDLRTKENVWHLLSEWAVELICEKVIGSAGFPLSPGDAFRRVLEALASGLLLPGSPGLLDPCEKDPVDATISLTAQEREDITASAQQSLRLVAFRQIHKVLGIDQLPAPKIMRGGGGRYNRKRRRNNSNGDPNDSDGDNEGVEGKKDRKDVEETKMELDTK